MFKLSVYMYLLVCKLFFCPIVSALIKVCFHFKALYIKSIKSPYYLLLKSHF